MRKAECLDTSCGQTFCSARSTSDAQKLTTEHVNKAHWKRFDLLCPGEQASIYECTACWCEARETCSESSHERSHGHLVKAALAAREGIKVTMGIVDCPAAPLVDSPTTTPVAASSLAFERHTEDGKPQRSALLTLIKMTMAQRNVNNQTLAKARARRSAMDINKMFDGVIRPDSQGIQQFSEKSGINTAAIKWT